MRTAIFDKGMKSLRFFDTRNTAIDMRCPTIAEAKKIIKKNGVKHNKIEVYNMCSYVKTEFLK
jgi:glutaredoxin-related protein